MDFSIGIFVPIIVAFAVLTGVTTSQLYLQPSKNEHGYFTNDSFFITCFTTDETIDRLTWLGNDENVITAREGRIHIEPASGRQQGLELVVESVEKQDAGRYVCSDVHDSIYFDLIVYKSISFSDTPKVQHAPERENAIITCNVKSDPKPQVNWYFNGSKLASSDKYKVSHSGLTLYNVSRSDAGVYKCKAFVITPLGSQVNEFDINFHVQYSPEWMEDQKDEAYASLGALANLSCSVSADPFPKFEWLRDGDILHNSSDYMIFNTENRSILQMTVQDKSQLGDYTCRASNNLGWKEKVLELREGDTPLPPHIAVTSEDQGTITLNLIMQEEKFHDELKVTGFKVQYMLATDNWDQAKTEEFDRGDQFVLKNMSYNSEYILRAASGNAAGYGDYSEEIQYTTHALQVAPVVADGAIGIKLSSSVLLLIAFLLWVQH